MNARSVPELVAGLEALVAAARPVPLTGHVRISREDAHALLDELRVSAPETHQRRPDGSDVEAVLRAVDALDEALFAARRIPLSDQVRVSRTDLDGYVADLRRAAPRW